MFDKTQHDNGYNYYIIPKGTFLYRGDTPAYIYEYSKTNKVQFMKTPYFFGISEKDVSSYGIIFEFETTEEYKLLALDNEHNRTKLYNESDNKIQKILTENYGYNSKKPSEIGNRYSVATADKELTHYLCNKLNMDGYANSEMGTETGYFHPELMICDTRHIKFNKIITKQNEIDSLIGEYTVRKLAPERKTKKRRSPERHSEELNLLFYNNDNDENKKTPIKITPIKRSLFSDNDSNETTPKVTRKLFGGKRKTIHRKTKKSKKHH